MPEDYDVRNGIAYRNGDSYAHCERCGFRPVVNHKCLRCDVVAPGTGSRRLADLLGRFCLREHRHGSSTWQSFDAALAAQIIEACHSGIQVEQATNQDYE